MLEFQKSSGSGDIYNEIEKYLSAIVSGEDDWLANLSNAASILFNMLPDINWAGFYLYKKGELVLGPFQGKPACVRIPLGKGVCGTAAAERQVQLVPDVHEFPGHIACDEASRSEIVIPVVKGNRLIGVLDIDSPVAGRFNANDSKRLQLLIEIINEHTEWFNEC